VLNNIAVAGALFDCSIRRHAICLPISPAGTIMSPNGERLSSYQAGPGVGIRYPVQDSCHPGGHGGKLSVRAVGCNSHN